MPLLTSDKEQCAYALIRQQCNQMKAEILALGGIPNHVHLMVTLPTTLCIADFMESVKGITSAALNHTYGSPTFAFKWQGGYSYHSVSPSHVTLLTRYIENQKQHHVDNTLWPTCEPPVKDTQ